jgi:hypothetical protein
MNEIIESRWKFRDSKTSVPVLLRSLGIEFRKVKEQSFWHANRFSLREIYAEFISEARTRYRELHPDTGGNAEEFAAFVESVNRAKHSFRWNMRATGQLDTSAPETTLIAKRGQLPFGFYRPKKVSLALDMIRKGHADREVERALKINRNTVMKIKRIISGVVNGCACGKPRGHKGWCKIMMARSPKRQAVMKGMHERQRLRKAA